ncbi:nitrilotriacetate monooxygenase, partial [Klebsiella pneumoniae]
RQPLSEQLAADLLCPYLPMDLSAQPWDQPL